MSKEIIVGKNQKRRIRSMLGKSFSAIKYVLFLALFLAVPVDSWAQFFNTDGVSPQLFAPWDLRGRDTFIQVTNTSDVPAIPKGLAEVFVHVQIFNAATGCLERDFEDSYTQNDTHVYNLRALTRNNGSALNLALPDGGFGIFVVTVTNGPGGPILADFVLNGNYRIIDAAGYEYRSNIDSVINLLTSALGNGVVTTFNFNTVAGANASDVIGIVVANAFTSDVIAGPGVSVLFNVDQFDFKEDDVSCDTFRFSCSPGGFNVGINSALPNSKGAGSLCSGFSDPIGLMELTNLDSNTGGADYFTGYVGLNNGDGTGSMDTWWISIGQNQTNPTALTVD